MQTNPAVEQNKNALRVLFILNNKGMDGDKKAEERMGWDGMGWDGMGEEMIGGGCLLGKSVNEKQGAS